MKRVLVTGCGGHAGIGFIRSLRNSPEKFYVVGSDCDEYNIFFGEAEKKYLVPRGSESNYVGAMNEIIKMNSIELLHAQPEGEISFLAKNRDKLQAKVFLPNAATIEITSDKMRTNQVFRKKNVPAAQSFELKAEEDLKKAFEILEVPIWLRASKGAGGKGCMLVKTFEEAKKWVDSNNGWNSFMAAEYLPGKNVGCDMLFKDGELICSQAKERIKYVLEKANPMGITGTTGILRTTSDESINKTAEQAVLAVDGKANGIFAVDLKQNAKGIYNVTEINSGRFLSSSTHLFYKSGLQIPYLYVKLAYDEKLPEVKKYNPLPENQYLVRQLDAPPIYITGSELEKAKNERKQKGFAEIV